MNFSAHDKQWMRRALALALRGEGLTSPNPLVGAVIVRNGEIVGEGYHRRPGEVHAEINAIESARKRGRKIAGSTLYVTLEPCSTQGRTPPCVAAIVREKFGRVVIGAIDPNPSHAGRGLKLLRRAGIDVQAGLFAAEAEEMNRDFNRWITTGRPWVTAKIAQSLDGRINAPRGERWLTSLPARRAAHELRRRADAIIIGAETARVDNPQLTIRLVARRGKTQPWRVILTRSGKLPRGLHLFNDKFSKRTLIYKDLPIADVLKRLGRRGVMNVLVEGGGRLLGEFFTAGAVDELAFFIAPCVGGRGPRAVEWAAGAKSRRGPALRQIEISKIGPDYLFRARVAPKK